MKVSRRFLPHAALLAGGAVASITLVAPSARADLPKDQLCIPTLAGTPVINGIMGTGGSGAIGPDGFARDTGWDGAAEVQLQDVQGTGTRYGTLKLGYKTVGDAGYLYLGAVIDQDRVKAADTIVIGLVATAPEGTTVANGTKIVIRPFVPSEETEANFSGRGLFTTPTARYAKYWVLPGGDETWWNVGANGTTLTTATGSWLGTTDNFSFAKEGNSRWSFEMRIPRKAPPGSPQLGVYLGTKGSTLKLFFDVISTQQVWGVSDDSYQQYPWPAPDPSVPATAGRGITDEGDDVETLMPKSSKWGAITLGAGSCGISLTGDKIGVKTPGDPSGTLDSGRSKAKPFTAAECSSLPATGTYVTNQMVAIPHSTQPAPVTDLKVDFSISQFGISADWKPLSTKTVSIYPGSDQEVVSPWSMSEQEACKLVTAWDHQCFRVELSSPTANILTPSVQRNMYWGVSSVFEGNAAIDPRKHKLPKSGRYRIHVQLIDTVLSAQDEETALADGVRPPVCGPGDPLSGSPACECFAKWNYNDDVHPKCLAYNDERGWTSKPYETLHRVVKASLLTGKTISIAGRKYEEMTYLGSYAFMVRHFVEPTKRGTIDVGWTPAFAVKGGISKAIGEETDTGLMVRTAADKRVRPAAKHYLLDLAPDEVAQTTTTVKTVEGLKGSFGASNHDQCSQLPPLLAACCCPAPGATTTGSNDRLPRTLGVTSMLAIALLGLRRRARPRR